MQSVRGNIRNQPTSTLAPAQNRNNAGQPISLVVAIALTAFAGYRLHTIFKNNIYDVEPFDIAFATFGAVVQFHRYFYGDCPLDVPLDRLEQRPAKSAAILTERQGAPKTHGKGRRRIRNNGKKKMRG